MRDASAVVCGAGIAGIAAAWHLSQRPGMDRVVVVDPEPPLSVTSDKSTECYRNWWPGPGTAMVDLVSRSISLLESLARESDNRFNMNRRGYAFATARTEQVAVYRDAAAAAVERGIGPLREHAAGSPASFGPGSTYRPGEALAFDADIDGCDLLTDPDLIRQHFRACHPIPSGCCTCGDVAG